MAREGTDVRCRLVALLGSVLIAASVTVAGPATARPPCPSFSEAFEGTASGAPEETVTGSVDEVVHEAEIGSSDCRIAELRVTLSSSDPAADFDLWVEWEGVDVGRSATASSDESVVLEGPPWGAYTFRVEPWLVAEAPYKLRVDAELERTPRTRGFNSTRPFVVIAVVDTGINPYHQEFAAEGYPDHRVDLGAHPSTYVEEYPREADALELSLGAPSYDDALAADEGTWEGVEEGRLYWIPGTKIIGAYDDGGGIQSDPHNVLDEHGHGTKSAGVAAGNTTGSCDRCLIVAVEGTGGLSWALAQPWIDLVTNSWGNLANAGVPTAGIATVDPFGIFGERAAKNTHAAVGRGQTTLFAAGNGLVNAFATPETTLTSPYTGPDWVMTVGAIWRHADEEGNCGCPDDESIILASGKPVDVSSYALGEIPAPTAESVDGYDDHSGTSAATPITAGVMGDVLHHAREQVGDRTGGTRDDAVAEGRPSGTGLLADGVLTRAELEDVVKRTAEHTTSRWIGIYPVSPPTVFAPDDALWTQWAAEGWGVVLPRTGERAKAVLDGEAPLPERSMDEAMAEHDRTLREALWGPSPGT